MANHKSALKRAKQNEKKNLRNKAVRTTTKKAVKSVQTVVAAQNKDEALKELDLAKSNIDKAVKKGVLHKKTGSRKISRLTKLVNTIAS